jgi:hypothetical protein
VTARLADLRIKHDASHTSIGKLRPGFEDVTDPREVPGAIHAAIHRHEESGRDALYLGRREFAYIEGMTLEESEGLLDELWRYASLPQNIRPSLSLICWFRLSVAMLSRFMVRSSARTGWRLKHPDSRYSD